MPAPARSALMLAIAALVTGCAAPAIAPPAAPPLVALPVPPRSVDAPKAPASGASVPAGAVAPWIVRVERSEATTAAHPCQMATVTRSTILLAEVREDHGSLVARVVQDDEKATGVAEPASLLGKGYRFDRDGAGVRATLEAGGPVAAQELPRVTALAAGLSWPGRAIVERRPAAGDVLRALEAPLASLAWVPLHGEPAQSATVTARTVGPGAFDGVEAIVLDVIIAASTEDAGMCHRWKSEAELTGKLRVRASDGALLDLTLEGPERATEGLCQDPTGKPGPPPPPKLCAQGVVRVSVRQPHVPAL